MLDTGLSAHAQFLAEVHAIPMYSDEDRDHLATLACQGNHEARKKLVESIIPLLVHTAHSCASWCQHLSLLDIVQVGCEALLCFMDRSLWVENPVAYLVRCAQNEMVRACSSRRGLVTTPRDTQPYQFVSLDRPFNDDEHSETLADILPAPVSVFEDGNSPALYQALAQLSEDRRELLARHYGLFGLAATPLLDLAHEMYPEMPEKQAYNVLRNREQRALMALQTLMTPAYLPEIQNTPEEFYTATFIGVQFGINSGQLRFWVSKGLLMRYPAPDTLYSRHVPYVYAKTEVDALVANWQPRKHVSGKNALHARRPTPSARRPRATDKEEVA